MTVPILSLSQVNWTTMNDGQPLPAATLNAGMNNGYTLSNQIIGCLADLQQSYASAAASPPTDKPAGKWWFESDTLLMKYYEVAGGTTRTVATLDGAQTLTNKTLTSPAIATPTITGPGGAATYSFPDVAARTIRVSGVDALSYVSAAGTAGTDNTAQIVKQIALPANTLNATGRGLRFRVLFAGNTATAIQTTFYLGTAGTTGDQVLTTTSLAATTTQAVVASVLYANATTTHQSDCLRYYANGAVPATGSLASWTGLTTNQNWAAPMFFSVHQAAVAATHITVYAILVEQLG